MRALLLVVLAGCGAVAPATDEDRLRAIMGRNDHHKLQIQYRTHAPDGTILEHLAGIEGGLQEVSGLRPFGDRRDALLADLAPRALIRMGELRAAPWTKANVEENWRRLEATCAGCHEAFDRR